MKEVYLTHGFIPGDILEYSQSHAMVHPNTITITLRGKDFTYFTAIMLGGNKVKFIHPPEIAGIIDDFICSNYKILIPEQRIL